MLTMLETRSFPQQLHFWAETLPTLTLTTGLPRLRHHTSNKRRQIAQLAE